MGEVSGIVIVDLPCVSCGYNLRMQPVTQVCPECGLAIEQSLRETALRWGPKFLRSMSRCAFWGALLAIAMPVWIVAATFGGSILLRNWVGRADFDWFRWYAWLQFALFSFFGLMAVAHAICVWRGIRPAPGEKASWRAWLARAGMGMFLLAILMLWLRQFLSNLAALMSLAVFEDALQDMEDAMRYALMAFPLLMSGLAIAASESSMRIREIYRRCGIQSGGFARWSLTLFVWSFILLMSVMFVMLVAEQFFRDSLGLLEVSMAIVAIVSAIGAGLGLLLSSIALIIFSRAIKRLAQEAILPGAAIVGSVASASSTPPTAS